jgi:hypothetical protein
MRLMAGPLAGAALLATPPAAGAAAGPALSVDAAADRHAISPDIYGMNFADPVLAREIGLPVNRWGGNRTETYNWRIGASNTGRDWYFENIADCWDDAGAWCAAGNAARDWIQQVSTDSGMARRRC